MTTYQKFKKEEMIEELEGEGLSREEATKEVDRELNKKCKICGCTFFNGCKEGCYWIEDDLCSSCKDSTLEKFNVDENSEILLFLKEMSKRIRKRNVPSFEEYNKEGTNE